MLTCVDADEDEDEDDDNDDNDDDDDDDDDIEDDEPGRDDANEAIDRYTGIPFCEGAAVTVERACGLEKRVDVEMD